MKKKYKIAIMKKFTHFKLFLVVLGLVLVSGSLKWWFSPVLYAPKLNMQLDSTSLPVPRLEAPATWDSQHTMRAIYASVEGAKTSDQILQARANITATLSRLEQSKEAFVKSYRDYPPSLAMFKEVFKPRVAQRAEEVAQNIFEEMLRSFGPLYGAVAIKELQIKDGDLNDNSGEVRTYIELSRQASIKAHLRWLRLQSSGASRRATPSTTGFRSS